MVLCRVTSVCQVDKDSTEDALWVQNKPSETLSHTLTVSFVILFKEGKKCVKSDFDRSRKLLNTLQKSRTAVIDSQNKNNIETDVCKLNNRFVNEVKQSFVLKVLKNQIY